MSYVLLVVGFVLLIKGADFFVEGAAAIAKKFHVPGMIIGMTIVAMGTSAPECAVSINASLKGNNELAVSNVIGSNIFNLMIVCGVCALIVPLAVKVSTLKREFPFSIVTAILLLVTGGVGMSLGIVDGVIMLVIFIIFLLWMIKSAQKARLEVPEEDNQEEEDIKDLSILRSLIYIVCGLIAVLFGSDWVVDGASDIALAFGLSQNLVGLTIVACGTSLPELVTSIVASKKNEVDMALGNVIGSNIFNILLILGLAAVITPVAFNVENIIDLVILIVFSTEVFFFARKGHDIKKSEGIIMIAEYIAYLVYICIR